MNIRFIPLAESHFPLLFKWLETPHAKEWGDQDIVYNINLVKEKFGTQAHGKPINNASNKLTMV
jgi:aminoglycoside 6'-N-acetyltransferase